MSDAAVSSGGEADCLFCHIIAGEIGSKQVYADDRAVAFLDIGPSHDGHTLVVPRRHVADLIEDPSAWGDVQAAIEALVPRLVDTLAADGLNVLINAGDVSGQEVRHLHVHLIPRYAHTPGMAAMLPKAAKSDVDEVHAKIMGGAA